MSKGIRGKKAAALVEKALYGYPLFPQQKKSLQDARNIKAVIDVSANIDKIVFDEPCGTATARLRFQPE